MIVSVNRPASRPRLAGVAVSTLVHGLIVLVSFATVSAATGQGPAPPESERIDIRGANFRGADLTRANLADTDARDAFFLRADVRGASFWRTRLDGADLRGIKGLTRQQLSSAQWSVDNPPKLDTNLNGFLQFWTKKRMQAQSLPGANWWGADLRGFNFMGADLRQSVLIHADLRGAVLQRADVSGAVFAGADLSGVDLRAAKGLTLAQLVSATWDSSAVPIVGDRLQVGLSRWSKRRLAAVSLAGAILWQKNLRGINLTGANLERTVLLGADLRGAVLQRASLAGAVWTGADISGADLRAVKGLTASLLFSARWDRENPPVLSSSLNVDRNNFEHLRMPGRSLDGTNLWGANLAGAILIGASLRETVLIDADLSGANATRADLTGANLTRANISGADLRGAVGFGVAQLLSARWDPKRPPTLGTDLVAVRKFWQKRNLTSRGLASACLWDVDLAGGKLQNADLTGVAFVNANLVGADLQRSDLKGALFFGSDISGVDFRGTRGLTAKMVLSARWNRRNPPIFDRGFDVLRRFIERKRFEFDLTRVSFQGPDPEGSMGPVRSNDRAVRFSPADPPRLGLLELIELIRRRRFGQMSIIP